jgi:hypothetical protein
MSFLQRQPRAIYDDIKQTNGKAAQATPLYENCGRTYIGSYCYRIVGGVEVPIPPLTVPQHLTPHLPITTPTQMQDQKKILTVGQAVARQL